MTRVLLISSLLVIPALAQAEPDAPTRYDFADHLIDGDYPVPLEDFVHARKRTARTTLVQVRSTFVPELLKSVEEL